MDGLVQDCVISIANARRYCSLALSYQYNDTNESYFQLDDDTIKYI